ncbi:uncharacterized protein LOC118193164 [Stegodyphus dumicola]|uniref:uncharacterized protein LOC118193164 n=1 Tax=Stegodyphus dumicola TaxID=202533 RepID=UPI0015A80E96|nr:uncharacterized protein LOC118193164 [Stegodyphus dumicola]XP_035220106.1 uncharacterized protein LOC118193164 [Stegodyphus dumicola]XP_035220115.1 uncharacterized protein LOC118193164 [Stegodyphus dumicola]XP_035220122.1 uncharacterized protein LOC118193164 [Stegodyphus dumicola]
MALRFLTVTDKTTAYDGEELFRNVTGVQDDEIKRVHTPTESSRREDLRRKGARIRELCDEFERSPQGQEIKKIVDEIDPEETTEEDLQDVIGEIFGGEGGGGQSWFRIAGFFSFCKNLFIRGCKVIIDVCKAVCKTIYRIITNIVSKVFNWIKSFFGWLI